MEAKDIRKKCFVNRYFFNGWHIKDVEEYLKKLNPRWKCTSTTWHMTDFELNGEFIQGMGAYDLLLICHTEMDDDIVIESEFSKMKL